MIPTMKDTDANGDPPGRDHPMTTMHIARAADGDSDSLEWLVARLSPLLREHASFRLGAVLRRHCDPDDLVNDAWVAALPKLPSLVEDPTRRRTPILLKYLSTTVVMRIRHLARQHARVKERTAPTDSTPPGEQLLSIEQSGAITRAVRGEQRSQLHDALAELPAKDREIVLLRGIEQVPARTAAAMLEIGVDAVNKRYQRALQRLRERLPKSVFSEME